MTKETKLSIFLFKIIHNILPHTVLFCKMKITDSESVYIYAVAKKIYGIC